MPKLVDYEIKNGTLIIECDVAAKNPDDALHECRDIFAQIRKACRNAGGDPRKMKITGIRFKEPTAP